MRITFTPFTGRNLLSGVKSMNLQAPEPHETLPKFELNGIRRGLFVRLMDDSGSFIWAAVRGRQGDVFFGVVEHTDEGGPPMGQRISFEKKHVFEVI